MFGPRAPDEAALWEEKIIRAVDMGEAEFTWKCVSIPSLPVIIGVISESAQRPFKRVQTTLRAIFPSLHQLCFVQRVAPSRTDPRDLSYFWRTIKSPHILILSRGEGGGRP